MDAGFACSLRDGRAGFADLLDGAEAWLAGCVPPQTAAPVMIALDEVISNALDHGGAGVVVDLAMRLADGAVTVEVADDGPPFDPLSLPPPDTALSLDERAIGGLGVHLVRRLMDSVGYAREGNRNRLRFSKALALG